MPTPNTSIQADHPELPAGIIHHADTNRFTRANYSEALTALANSWTCPRGRTHLLEFIAPTTTLALGPKNQMPAKGAYAVGEQLTSKGLTIRVLHDDVVGEDWRERYLQLLLQRLTINALREAMHMLEDVSAHSTQEWSAAGEPVNPDLHLREIIQELNNASGLRPNRLLFGETAWELRSEGYESQASAGPNRVANLTPDELASKLFMDHVKVVPSSHPSIMDANAVYVFHCHRDAAIGAATSTLKRFVSPSCGLYPIGVYIEEHAKFTDLSVDLHSALIAQAPTGMAHKLTVK